MYSMNHGHVFAAQRETHSPFNDLRASNDSIFRIRTFYGFSTEVLRVPSTQNIGSTVRKTNSACWLMTAWPKRTGTRSFIPPSRTVLNSKRCRKWRSLSPLWKKSTPLPVVYMPRAVSASSDRETTHAVKHYRRNGAADNSTTIDYDTWK